MIGLLSSNLYALEDDLVICVRIALTGLRTSERGVVITYPCPSSSCVLVRNSAHVSARVSPRSQTANSRVRSDDHWWNEEIEFDDFGKSSFDSLLTR